MGDGSSEQHFMPEAFPGATKCNKKKRGTPVFGLGHCISSQLRPTTAYSTAQ